MASDEALLDGAEHRLVGLEVDVDILELADLVTIAVEELLAAPVREVADFSDLDLPRSLTAYARKTLPREPGLG
jgi:hypothetical protein